MRQSSVFAILPQLQLERPQLYLDDFDEHRPQDGPVVDLKLPTGPSVLDSAC